MLQHGSFMLLYENPEDHGLYTELRGMIRLAMILLRLRRGTGGPQR